MTINWPLVLAITIMLSGTLMILSMPILRLTLDRRVRKALPRDHQYDSSLDWYGGITRAIVFGLCCVFPHVNNAPMYRHLYDDFDVAAFADTFEKTIAYIMTFSTLILVTLGVIFVPLDWLGIYKLGD